MAINTAFCTELGGSSIEIVALSDASSAVDVTPIGWCRVYYYSDSPNIGYISSLGVADAYRRQGVGNNLIKKAQSALREQGCTCALLQVDKSSWMREWYIHLGFKHFQDDQFDPKMEWLKKKL